MFGSSFLDVVIGLIFIYLVVSLVCSAANEVLEGWLKNRATDLERGIREMFGLGPNQKGPDEKELMQQLYDNPMINGLFKGKYGQGAKGKWQRLAAWLGKGPNLPSYIPARNFALAMMDIATIHGAPPVASPPLGISSPPDGIASAPSGATGATPPTPQSNVTITLTAIPPAPPAPGQPGNRLTVLRNGVVDNKILPEQVKSALLTLIDAAGNDVAKARENIENWFNSSMDRVSGWYKRRTQLIILILGLLIAAGANVDSIVIVRHLSTDKSLRDSLVSAAQEYAKANPAPAPANPSATPAASPVATPAPPAAANSSAASAAYCSQGDACRNNPNSPECRVEKNLCLIKKQGLPIGWYTTQADVVPPFPPHGPLTPWLVKLLGWVVTALAVSLGAPFWFDMLNKIIVVRSTVKPHEKSPEETSKQ